MHSLSCFHFDRQAYMCVHLSHAEFSHGNVLFMIQSENPPNFRGILGTVIVIKISSNLNLLCNIVKALETGSCAPCASARCIVYVVKGDEEAIIAFPWQPNESSIYAN